MYLPASMIICRSTGAVTVYTSLVPSSCNALSHISVRRRFSSMRHNRPGTSFFEFPVMLEAHSYSLSVYFHLESIMLRNMKIGLVDDGLVELNNLKDEVTWFTDVDNVETRRCHRAVLEVPFLKPWVTSLSRSPLSTVSIRLIKASRRCPHCNRNPVTCRRHRCFLQPRQEIKPVVGKR